MVEPGELDPIFDSGPEIVCEGGCHFSRVPLEKSCLLGVFLFVCFPILTINFE